MNTYGYLINLDYKSNNEVALWDFERYESEGLSTPYKGIEGIGLKTCDDYVIVGNSEEFQNWLNTGFEPGFPVL